MTAQSDVARSLGSAPKPDGPIGHKQPMKVR